MIEMIARLTPRPCHSLEVSRLELSRTTTMKSSGIGAIVDMTDYCVDVFVAVFVSTGDR